MKEGAVAVLMAVDEDLSNLRRFAKAFVAITNLRYILSRLASIQFSETTEWLLEHEMLTSAFVVTYARLAKGGNGSGISKGKLPANLRTTHEEILDLRNRRYAHDGSHESIQPMMAVT